MINLSYYTLISIKYFCLHVIGLNVSHDWILPRQNWEYPCDIPQFSKPCVLQKYLMDNKLSRLSKLSLYMYCKLCNDIESDELWFNWYVVLLSNISTYSTGVAVIL